MAIVYTEMVESNQMAFDPGQTELVEHLGILQSAIEDYEPFWKSIYLSKNKKTNLVLPTTSKKSTKSKKDYFRSFFVQNRQFSENTKKSTLNGDYN